MLGIVLINYKNEIEVSEYVFSELSKIKTEKKIIIVDNSFNDNNYERLLELTGAYDTSRNFLEGKEIYAINARENLGYARANNIGALFLIKYFTIEYLLFSNSDITFHDCDVVDHLISKFKNLANVGAINPKIIGNKKENLTPIKYISSKRLCLNYLFFPIFYYIRRRKYYKNYDEGKYYCLNGSFLLMKKDSFVQCGMFDQNTFLFFEEQILAERLLKIGYGCYYIPEKTIIHNVSSTIGKSFSILEKEKLIIKSGLYYYNEYLKAKRLELFFLRISFNVYKNIYLRSMVFIKKLFF